MNKFDFTNKHDIATVSQAFKDIKTNYPIVFDFLDKYCGFNSPLMSTNPYEICYSQGKRDVILMINTLMRDDISPEQIAHHYK